MSAPTNQASWLNKKAQPFNVSDAPCIYIVSQCPGDRIVCMAIRSIGGTALVKEALGPFIFSDYLGPTLESGNFVPAPTPIVVVSSL